MAILEQTILWRRLDLTGYDSCGLWSLDDAWRLAGTSVFCLDDQPCCLSYEVNCDAFWHTRSAKVTGWMGTTSVQLELDVLQEGHWSFNGVEQPQLNGLIDVDLGFTPATNLIQLRRLSLSVGHQVDARVAYLDFPEFTITRLEHHNHRVEFYKYDYKAPRFDYVATLSVSDVGFVTQYPGLWELVALHKLPQT